MTRIGSPLVIVALLGLCACSTGTLAPSADTGSADTAGSGGSRPATTAPTSPDLIVLTCQDSAGQTANGPWTTVNGVSSPSLAGTRADPDDVLTITGPDDRPYLLWKVFLNVDPSATPWRTVSVISPEAARLYYADPHTWGTASEVDRVMGSARRVRLPACGSGWSGYTGGILLPEPACVELAISSPASSSKRQITVPIATPRC